MVAQVRECIVDLDAFVFEPETDVRLKTQFARTVDLRDLLKIADAGAQKYQIGIAAFKPDGRCDRYHIGGDHIVRTRKFHVEVDRGKQRIIVVEFKFFGHAELGLWHRDFCAFRQFLVLARNGVFDFLVFFFVDVPDVVRGRDIAQHQPIFPVVALKLDPGIDPETPGVGKIANDAPDDFRIDSVLPAGYLQTPRIRYDETVIGGREFADAVVVDIALLVDKLGGVKDVVHAKSHRRNTPGTAVVYGRCKCGVIISGNVRKIAGVHQRDLFVLDLDKAGRIPITGVDIHGAGRYGIGHTERCGIHANVHEFVGILPNRLGAGRSENQNQKKRREFFDHGWVVTKFELNPAKNINFSAPVVVLGQKKRAWVKSHVKNAHLLQLLCYICFSKWPRMNIKKHVPNAITLGNLMCGCIAVVYAFHEDFTMAFLLVCAGIFLDFFDGFFARMFNVSSPLGLQLDSLADMVTSGVTPGLAMYQLMKSGSGWDGAWIPFLGFVITLGSCYRLANFNIDTRQTDSFIGLPTPANALFIMSLPLVKATTESFFMLEILTDHGILLVISLFSAYILNAEIPLFSLKVKEFSLKKNTLQIVFLALAVLLLAGLQFTGVPLVIMLYVLLSVVNNKFFKK